MRGLNGLLPGLLSCLLTGLLPGLFTPGDIKGLLHGLGDLSLGLGAKPRRGLNRGLVGDERSGFVLGELSPMVCGLERSLFGC